MMSSSNNNTSYGNVTKKRRLDKSPSEEEEEVIGESNEKAVAPKVTLETDNKESAPTNDGAAVEQAAIATTTTATTSSNTLKEDESSNNNNTTVYIGGLHPRVQRPHLEKLLSKFGTMERLHILETKGVAFCTFSTKPQAQAAISSLHEKTLLGKALRVQFAKQQASIREQQATRWTRPKRANNNNNNKATSLDDRIRALKRKFNEKEKR